MDKEENMDKLKGYRTYITMVVMIVLGAIEGWNQYCGGTGCKIVEVPGFVFSILAALGIYTRSIATPKA